MKIKKIGFVGTGFIGSAYSNDFERRGFNVVRYSLDKKYIKNKRKLKSCWLVFVAVPTPTTFEKGFDDSILEDAIKNCTSKGQIVVIKSTVKIGTTEKMQNKFKDRYILHSPEFLTEKTAIYDARNPDRNIVGYTKKSKRVASRVINVLPVAPFESIVPAREAELTKYAGNVWFYMKVLTNNLIYDVAKKYNVDHDSIVEMLGADKRVGRTHLTVVHQGGRGAGGDCFIKDFATFREMYFSVMGENSLGSKMLVSAEEFNEKLLSNSGKSIKLLNNIYGKKYKEKK